MNILSEIVVNEVSKSIYGVPIINSVSMTLVSGNVYGFQGINGSGKTMLMRLICGLIYPTKGEIVIDGKRLGKAGQHRGRQLSAVHLRPGNRHLLCAGADRQSFAVGLAGSSDPFGSNAGGDPDPQKAGPPNHTEPPAEGPSEKIVNIISKKKPDCAARSPVFLVSLS